MEYLFHISSIKDGKLLQRVGVFRVQRIRIFFDELAAVVFQTPADLPVLYPVGSLEKVL